MGNAKESVKEIANFISGTNGPGAAEAGGFRHHRSHLPGGKHQAGLPGGRLPRVPGSGPPGLQLLRIPA